MTADIILVIRDARICNKEAKSFRRQLNSLVAPGLNFVLHMSGVEDVDSQGAGAILDFALKLNSSGGKLRLVGLQKKVTAFFEMLRLNRSIEICGSRAELRGSEIAA